MLKEELLENLITEINSKFPNVRGIYQFGSSLDYDLEDCNDVDIAVLLDSKLPELICLEFQNDLSLSTSKKIDLIQLRTVSTVFQHEIFTKGKRIYALSESFCDDYEAINLSLYQKLNEERAEILEEVKSSKKVYDI